jgi:hypothetical protein
MLCLPTVSLANTIVVGDHVLQPNQAGQVISLYMTGSDAYGFSTVRTFINGDVAGAPVISHVFGTIVSTIPGANLTGSIWEGGAAGVYNSPPYATASIGDGLQTGATFQLSNPLDPSTTPGLYVTFTFDTTGVAPGVYSFSLTDSPIGPTEIFSGLTPDLEPIPTPLEIINGSLTVVPEPGSLALALAAMAGMAFVAIRNRVRRAA